jgi:chromosome segregation ATPase
MYERGRGMCKSVSFFFVFFCLLAASLHSEQWYRVSETELQKLEALSQNSETNRLNWLSQANELKEIVRNLQKGSKILNGQLEEEREATKSLRKSFEQSALEQLQRASEYEAEIDALKEKNAGAEKEVLKVKNQRNALFFILASLTLAVSAALYFKIKRLFPKL